MLQFVLVIIVVFGALAAIAAASLWIDRDADEKDVAQD